MAGSTPKAHSSVAAPRHKHLQAPKRLSRSGDRRHGPDHAPVANFYSTAWPDFLTHSVVIITTNSSYCFCNNNNYRCAVSCYSYLLQLQRKAATYYCLAPRPAKPAVACKPQPRCNPRLSSDMMASNGLPPAKTASPPGSPARSASVSLQAAATMNASLQREPSPRTLPLLVLLVAASAVAAKEHLPLPNILFAHTSL